MRVRLTALAPLALVALVAATPAPGPTPAAAAAPVGPPLAGTRVVLDAGHNGGNGRHPEIVNRLVEAGGIRKACNTTGTATNAGYAEHAFTYDVARRTAALLRRDGVTVSFTRTNDRGVGPCIDRRAAIGNAARADAVVSIHADGAPSRARGFHVIEPALAPDRGNRGILTPSARLATALRTRYASVTGLRRATYPGGILSPGLARRRDLGGLNLSRVPAVFIECGNMRNAADARVLASPAGRQRIAQGIASGVEAYLSVTVRRR